jgi:Ser/Thr protein kinase RdoA (MazF antagonist)
MSRRVDAGTRPVCTEDLRAGLGPLLSAHLGGGRFITRLARKLSEYLSSFTLEELDVALDDGTRLSLIFKDLGWEGLLPDARRVKPAFLYNPLREIEIYRGVLAGNGLGTATCYGAVVDPGAGRYWLFLERVRGLRLSDVGAFATWERVARHLAALHARFEGGPLARPGAPASHLLRYDPDYYWRWAERTTEFVRSARPAVSAAAWRRLERLVGRYQEVVDRLAALPRTFIHGEFYPSNVLVTRGARRLCVVDWEMAGVGPGLIDLAALTAGDWTDGQKSALALAYHAAFPAGHPWRRAPDAFLEALDFCRLHLAMQCLGWSPDWSPPREHARNWLGEALRLAEKLGL